jgi:hypothetical protein
MAIACSATESPYVRPAVSVTHELSFDSPAVPRLGQENGLVYVWNNFGPPPQHWRSDGTPEGTVELSSNVPVEPTQWPIESQTLDIDGNRFYVERGDLWIDPVDGPPRELKQAFQGSEFLDPTQFVNVNGSLYFTIWS